MLDKIAPRATRVIVQENIYDAFVEKLTNEVNANISTGVPEEDVFIWTIE